MAFVSVSTKSFLGDKISSQVCPTSRSRVAMKANDGLDKMLEKYYIMAATRPQPSTPSPPSSVWKAYAKTMLEKVAPLRSAMFTSEGDYLSMMSQLKFNATAANAPGGDPANIAKSVVADSYMAECVTNQYKMSACPSGVYGIQCTEGSAKFQAEESRVMALATRFRLGQRSTVQKYGDFFEMRRKAISAAHECSYEEKLSGSLPQVAAAVVRGYTESKNICVRYAISSSPEEQYMASCVDKQSKFRAVPYGVYDVLCQDGSVSGIAEFKRVQALSAKFRANQLPAIVKEDSKFEVAKYARANYSHMCEYEEKFFNTYPAVAASMRPSTVRY